MDSNYIRKVLSILLVLVTILICMRYFHRFFLVCLIILFFCLLYKAIALSFVSKRFDTKNVIYLICELSFGYNKDQKNNAEYKIRQENILSKKLRNDKVDFFRVPSLCILRGIFKNIGFSFTKNYFILIILMFSALFLIFKFTEMLNMLPMSSIEIEQQKFAFENLIYMLTITTFIFLLSFRSVSHYFSKNHENVKTCYLLLEEYDYKKIPLKNLNIIIDSMRTDYSRLSNNQIITIILGLISISTTIYAKPKTELLYIIFIASILLTIKLLIDNYHKNVVDTSIRTLEAIMIGEIGIENQSPHDESKNFFDKVKSFVKNFFYINLSINEMEKYVNQVKLEREKNKKD